LSVVNDIGLGRHEVAVRPYNPAWPDCFAIEARRLRKALGPAAAHLEHVGSTAVPGLAAKPVIDLALGLADPVQLDDLTGQLRLLGYAAFGERLLTGDHFFALGPPEARTHYLHVVALAGIRWKNYLHVRDRLRADPSLRDAYSRLKVDLAAHHPSDRSAYAAGKEALITSLLLS
jgi:GrpB-like predicted nucleotidyltransferase (UPF0157 family)